MRAGDLTEARRLVELRETDLRMLSRLRAAERLRLTLGEGGDTAEIILASSYLDRLREDVCGGLEKRIARHDAALAALGVEP